MSGPNSRRFGQCCKYLQRTFEVAFRTTGQIGATDAALKQNIATETPRMRGKIKRHRSGRMARHMKHAHFVTSALSFCDALPIVIGQSDFGRGQAEPDGLFAQMFNEKIIRRVHPNRHVESAFPARVIVDVIEMAVRIPDRSEFVTSVFQFVHPRERLAAVNSRVNNQSFARRIVVEQIHRVDQRASDESF